MEIQVEEHDLHALRLFGFIRTADDGVDELTEKGEAWLKSWCRRQKERWTIAHSLD